MIQVAPAGRLGTDAPTAAAPTRLVIVDGHAHYYPVFGPARFLEAAARNLSRAAGPTHAAAARCVILAGRHGERSFGTLLKATAADEAGAWRLVPTGERGSLAAEHPERGRIHLIAARQVVTAEGLEVLAVPMARCLADGRTARDTVEDIVAGGDVPVLPWGVGKWWGTRGKAVLELLGSELGPWLCIGDIRRRAWPGPLPPAFRRAAEDGVRVLPGTDPLPIAADAEQVGSYGFLMHCPFDPDRPAESIRLALRGPVEPARCGRRCGWPEMLRSQLLLRIRRSGAGRETTA